MIKWTETDIQFHFASKTQSVHALSSGEAELYAIGSVVNELLHIKAFLLEAKISTKSPDFGRKSRVLPKVKISIKN